jgi:hypothetical protein
MYQKILFTVAVGAVVLGVYRGSRLVNRQINRKFRGLILADAAQWLSRRLQGSVEQIEAALVELVGGKPAGRLLDPLLRIECEVLPADAPTRREIRTHVWIKEPDGVKAGYIARTVPYEELAENVRAQFFQSGTDRQVWVIYERGPVKV